MGRDEEVKRKYLPQAFRDIFFVYDICGEKIIGTGWLTIVGGGIGTMPYDGKSLIDPSRIIDWKYADEVFPKVLGGE